MPDVRLVDLEVIRRYSLAVRQEAADAGELIEVLKTDMAALEKAAKALSGRGRRRAKSATTRRRTTTPRRRA